MTFEEFLQVPPDTLIVIPADARAMVATAKHYHVGPLTYPIYTTHTAMARRGDDTLVVTQLGTTKYPEHLYKDAPHLVITRLPWATSPWKYRTIRYFSTNRPDLVIYFDVQSLEIYNYST